MIKDLKVKKLLRKLIPSLGLCKPQTQKKTDLVILHTGTNDLKSVSSSEEITNEIVSLGVSVKENGQQIAV